LSQSWSRRWLNHWTTSTSNAILIIGDKASSTSLSPSTGPQNTTKHHKPLAHTSSHLLSTPIPTPIPPTISTRISSPSIRTTIIRKMTRLIRRRARVIIRQIIGIARGLIFFRIISRIFNICAPPLSPFLSFYIQNTTSKTPNPPSPRKILPPPPQPAAPTSAKAACSPQWRTTTAARLSKGEDGLFDVVVRVERVAAREAGRCARSSTVLESGGGAWRGWGGGEAEAGEGGEEDVDLGAWLVFFRGWCLRAGFFFGDGERRAVEVLFYTFPSQSLTQCTEDILAEQTTLHYSTTSHLRPQPRNSNPSA